MWDISLIADEIMYLQDVPRSEIHNETRKILTYPISHFVSYCRIVIGELIDRDYLSLLDIDTIALLNANQPEVDIADIFGNWHDAEYLCQDYKNLVKKDYLTEYDKKYLYDLYEDAYCHIC